MIEGMNGTDEALLMDGPIAGESLTQDPENPQAWETPPEYSQLEDFIDDLFLNVTQEDNIDGVLDPMRKGIPIDDIAQLLLFQAFSSGKISTDLMMSAIEPTVYMLVGLATFAEVEDPVLYPEDDMLGDDEAEISALEQAGRGEDVALEELPVPKGVSKSLIDKLKEGDI